MLRQLDAVARIFADVRIFGQKPVEKNYYKNDNNIENDFEVFEHGNFIYNLI